MDSHSRSFLNWFTVAGMWLVISPSFVKTETSCSVRHFRDVSTAAPSLLPSEMISNHSVNILVECYFHCLNERKCFGFNYREKARSEYTINCQLSNRTEKWNRTEIGGGWIHYQDARIIEDINECSQSSNACDSHADCINTFDSYMCECHNGYSKLGENCTDINECSEDIHTCDINADCTNTQGSYSCHCHSGYTGNGYSCSDINECSVITNDCDQKANCSNTEGSYVCQCNGGYTGSGKSCTDINECSLGIDGCDQNATCTNTEGSYECQCNSGYSGDGKTCTDINECSVTNNGCDQNAKCTNTQGSYECQCNSGYTGDGKTCTDINECSVANNGCDQNAKCTNTQGSYGCQCNDGYTGNGKTCTATQGKTCLDIKQRVPSATSGVYWIKPDTSSSSSSIQAYCDMDTNSGGWTLVYSYTFTNYADFGSGTNAVTPRPNWSAPTANVPISTTAPLSESTRGAMD